MGVTLGILIAFYLIFTQSVWVFARIFGYLIPVPNEMEVSYASAALIAGVAAGWMAHRYNLSAWRVGLLAGIAPVAVILIGTTLIGEFAAILQRTTPLRYALFAGEVALAILSCKLGALARAKVRGRPRPRTAH
ncbi:MAG TPA: hypothetical protein VI007_07240 [bacterium]